MPALPHFAADSASKALGAALAGQAAWLSADAEAVQRLLEVLLGADNEPTAELAGYVLPPADAASLGSALLAAAEAEVAAAAAAGSRSGGLIATALHVARTLLGFAVKWAPAAQLLAACQRLLAGGTALPAGAPGSPEAVQREGLLADAAACFTASRMEQLLSEPQAAATAVVLDTWCSLLAPAGAAGAAAARLAALQQVEPRVYELLPLDVQGRCLKVRRLWGGFVGHRAGLVWAPCCCICHSGLGYTTCFVLARARDDLFVVTHHHPSRPAFTSLL